MWLYEFLKPRRMTHILDVGANPIDGLPPYRSMLDQGLCTVTGFEPHDAAREELLSQATDRETYLPYALGEGGPETLHICAYSGWTSLLSPNTAAINVFSQFSANATVIEKLPIETHRLDDLEEVDEFDMLKIDVQGSELSIFRGGTRHLKQAVLIQTEISFISLYKDQPAFGEVDTFLRGLGFVPHCFAAIKQWPISPLQFQSTEQYPYHQLLEADIVYVKDFINAQAMDNEQLKQLCLLAHYVYRSIDLAGRCVELLVQRGAIAANGVAAYASYLNGRCP